MNVVSKNRLTVYLVKDNSIDDFLDEVRAKEFKLENKSISQNKEVFYQISDEKEPDWVSKFFSSFSTELSDLNSKHIRLIFTLKVKYNNKFKRFVITFGNGRTLLNGSAIEYDFGKVIVFKWARRDKIRRVETKKINANMSLGVEQGTYRYVLEGFDYNPDKDILKGLEIFVETEQVKGTVIGRNSLQLSTPNNVDDIEELVLMLYSEYVIAKKELRNEGYSWLVNSDFVTNKDLIEKLNGKVSNDLEKLYRKYLDINGEEEILETIDLHFAYTDISADIDSFNFKEEDENSFEVTTIDKLFNYMETRRVEENLFSVDRLKREYFYAHRGSDWEKQSIYRCISAEIQESSTHYFLFDGEWYRFNKSYVDRITNDFNRIKKPNIEIIEFSHSKEKLYNEDLAKSLCGYMMDKTAYQIQLGNHQKIELCDVLTKDLNLIHVKVGNQTSKLAYVATQVRNSAEFLATPGKNTYIEKNMNIPTDAKNLFLNIKSNSEITFVIIICKTETNAKGIPLLSKASIVSVFNELKRMDYDFRIIII